MLSFTVNECYICIKVYYANITISVCEKRDTFLTKIVMPVERLDWNYLSRICGSYQSNPKDCTMVNWRMVYTFCILD